MLMHPPTTQSISMQMVVRESDNTLRIE